MEEWIKALLARLIFGDNEKEAMEYIEDDEHSK